MSFEELGLNPEILKALNECGYTTPTPIQEKAIPPILMMRDVVGLAQTGTGKTAGFTLPMIEILAGGRAKARMPRSLILSPTRELAAQIADSFDKYGKYCKLSKALLVGGVSMDEQIKILERGADVLIATPGRFLDLFERGNILLTDIKIFVIDEADKMMDMGFIPDITKIAGLLPQIRQTLLFSATMPPEIKKLTMKFQSNPKEITVNPPAETAQTIKQFMVKVSPRSKKEALLEIIKSETVGNAFVFCNRKRDIDGLAKWLNTKGYSVAALHGDMSQSDRTKTLARLKNNEIQLLICSDVAARGIDIQGLSHVFNFDVPMNADDYVHRIGRTGRAGKEGRTWMIATDNEEKFVDAIVKLTKKDIELVYLSGTKPLNNAAKENNRDVENNRDAQKPLKSSKKDKSKSSGSIESAGKSSVRQTQSEIIRNNQKSQKEDQNNVIGFGDEMPAFFSNKG